MMIMVRGISSSSCPNVLSFKGFGVASGFLVWECDPVSLFLSRVYMQIFFEPANQIWLFKWGVRRNSSAQNSDQPRLFCTNYFSPDTSLTCLPSQRRGSALLCWFGRLPLCSSRRIMLRCTGISAFMFELLHRVLSVKLTARLCLLSWRHPKQVSEQRERNCVRGNKHRN